MFSPEFGKFYERLQARRNEIDIGASETGDPSASVIALHLDVRKTLFFVIIRRTSCAYIIKNAIFF